MRSVFDRVRGVLDRGRLARVLGMLGSTHDGEVLAAARLAETLRSHSTIPKGACSDLRHDGHVRVSTETSSIILHCFARCLTHALAARVGSSNVYLQPDGRDRLRDPKGKTVTCRARGAVIMLSAFDDVTMGLTLCEGVETGIAIFQSEQRPVWACGGAGSLATFPVLGGIECLTIAADQDEKGLRAGKLLAARWYSAGREVLIAAPPVGDWADE